MPIALGVLALAAVELPFVDAFSAVVLIPSGALPERLAAVVCSTGPPLPPQTAMETP